MTIKERLEKMKERKSSGTAAKAPSLRDVVRKGANLGAPFSDGGIGDLEINRHFKDGHQLV